MFRSMHLSYPQSKHCLRYKRYWDNYRGSSAILSSLNAACLANTSLLSGIADRIQLTDLTADRYTNAVDNSAELFEK